SEILAKRARARHIAKEVLVGDVFDLDVSHGFDMICLFDVLEHIADDNEFLKKINKFTEPGHLLLLSVPACQFLYSQHDALVHHYRRYSKKNFEILLKNNNYTILKSSYFLFLVFPVVVFSRMKEKVKSAMFGINQSTVNLGIVPKWMNWFLIAVLNLEAALS